MFHSAHHIRAFTIFCLFGALLSIIRIYMTDSIEYAEFVWNLILALVPYFFASIVVLKTGILRYTSLLLWFLFFPNSLYIWTDFVHLGEYPEMLHFDIVYISVMAIAGLICAFASLDILHKFWNTHVSKKIAWGFVSLSLIFGIYGVYIGRFLRLNSWDIIQKPMVVIEEIWNLTISNGSTIVITQTDRVMEASKYSVGIVSLSTFILLYFSLFMILYISLYHINRSH